MRLCRCQRALRSRKSSFLAHLLGFNGCDLRHELWFVEYRRIVVVLLSLTKTLLAVVVDVLSIVDALLGIRNALLGIAESRVHAFFLVAVVGLVLSNGGIGVDCGFLNRRLCGSNCIGRVDPCLVEILARCGDLLVVGAFGRVQVTL